MPTRRWCLLAVWLVLPVLSTDLRGQEETPLPKVGETVFGYWDPDGYWYCGQVKQHKGDETLVKWLQDGTENWLPPGQVVAYFPQAGEFLEVNYKWEGKYHLAKVLKVKRDRWTVVYEDEVEEQVEIGQFRIILGFQSGLRRGQHVFAFWPADGYWYPGLVRRIEKERVEIAYDDGETAWREPNEVLCYGARRGEKIEVCAEIGGAYAPVEVQWRRGRLLDVIDAEGETATVDLSHARADLGAPPE